VQNINQTGVLQGVTLDTPEGSVLISFPNIFIANENQTVPRTMTTNTFQNGSNSYILTFKFPGEFGGLHH